MRLALAALALILPLDAATPAKPPAKTAAKSTKPAVQTKKKSSSAKTPVRSVKRKPAYGAPRPPVVSAAVRAQAARTVNAAHQQGAEIPVENPMALVPFFEMLYRHQQGQVDGPLRILHYGDSHTAADEWTGGMRQAFQARFGDGGSGYSFAGRPWNSYRRLDVRGSSTRGWYTDGLVGRSGDGLYGLGGVAMTATRAGEAVYLNAECERVEIFYLQQPGGGDVNLYDNGALVERISTNGELAPGYYRLETSPGPHRFELETAEYKPVRIFGWAAENAKGVTYETLGINGAQASIVFGWDENLLLDNVARRNPALIVLAYGTNEARNRDWTYETYHDMFLQLIQRFRKAAPTASILVVGPPDHLIRKGRSWVPMEKLDVIVRAQREAALISGCAYWDLRARMGGKGSMRNWVYAGMAQGDYVHFTAPGYRLIGEAIFRDLMNEYLDFVQARQRVAEATVAGEDRH